MRGPLKTLRYGLLIVVAGWGLLVSPGISGVSVAGLQPVESDTRTVEWSTVRRLALEAGLFSPAYRPVSEGELADLLTAALDEAVAGAAPGFDNEDEITRLRWWLARYRQGGGGWTWTGTEDHAPRLRVSARAAAGFSELGSPFDQESGLAWSPGWNATFEPILDLAAGRWWISATGRLSGQVAAAGIDFSGPGGSRSPLTWPDWNIPTGRSQVRDARLQGDRWIVDVPRAVAGVNLGHWSLNAGWAPRRTGPGLTGALALDQSGPSFPSFTARRMKPFDWGSGFSGFLAPDELLMSTGRLSERLVRFRDENGTAHEKTAHPWFFQWLIGWRVTSWFRATFTHTAMAAPREGSLWGDILQINFPNLGTTQSELTRGPVTDRIFSAQFEARWRNAPWPILPSAGGRVFWEYAGTDVNSEGLGGWAPEIAVPASMVGVELVDPVWDLGLEYAELMHSSVLWYSNSGFPEGYSQDGWLLGNSLGGSGEAVTGMLRIRPGGWGLETGLRARHSTWGAEGFTPGTGEINTVALTVRRLPSGRASGRASGRHGGGPTVTRAPSPLLWELTFEWNREKAVPGAFTQDSTADPGAKKDWWRIYLRAGI